MRQVRYLPHYPRQSQNCGYTLIEILIALLIFSIISVIVLAVMQNILSVRDSVQAKSVELAKLQRAFTIISRDIEQAVDRHIMNENGQLESSFFARKEDGQILVDFTRAGFVNPQASMPRSTLQRVRYRLDGDRLYREFWSSLDRNNAREVTLTSMVILDKVDKLEWRFLDDKNESYEIWPPTGRRTPPPPALELTLSIENWGDINRLLLLPERRIRV